MTPKPPESTWQEKAAVGNGELQNWIEHEAEKNRDPREYRGGSQEGAMTNIEMWNYIQERKRDEANRTSGQVSEGSGCDQTEAVDNQGRND